MSRRNNNRGNGSTSMYTLSRKKFRRHFCRNCGICGESATMRFCYSVMYKWDPEAFADTIFPLMQYNKFRLKAMADSLLVADFQDLQLFRTIFCMPNSCLNCSGDLMPDVKNCFSSFCTQVSNSIRRANIRQNKVNKPKPEPEMFVAMYGDSSLEAEVARILENYNSK